MLYFEGDTSDFFSTRNRPPCRTKAEIEVLSVKKGIIHMIVQILGGKETCGEGKDGIPG